MVKRADTIELTSEMIELYRRGRALQAAGVIEAGARRDEYLQIMRRLDWVLLRRAPHMVSVLDPELGENFDAEAPPHMARHGDVNGWHSAQETARALQAAAATGWSCV